eukprot:1227727-Amphidinium_carterae.1
MHGHPNHQKTQADTQALGGSKGLSGNPSNQLQQLACRITSDARPALTVQLSATVIASAI